MVLDMGAEGEDTPIILGRPYLNTTNTIIFIRSGQVHFQFLDGKVRCHFNSYTNHEQPMKPHNRKRRRSRRQANQPLKDGWADYLGEGSRYEDRWNDEAEKTEVPTKEEITPSISNVQTTKVWREQKTTSTSSPQEEQSSESPSSGSNDATDN